MIRNKPDFLQDPSKFIKYAEEAFSSRLSQDAAKFAAQSGAKVDTQNSKRMTATIKTLANRGVIDMKPLFKNAKNTRVGKDGEWYSIVPIQVTRRGLREQTGNDKLYNLMRQATASIEAGGSATVDVAGIFSGKTVNALSSLQPTQATDNITAQKSQSGKRTSYVAYRTISQKSSLQSWVLNRGNVQEDNTSDSLKKGIEVLMRKRMKELGGK